MTNSIFVILGVSGTGKDTVCNILTELYNFPSYHPIDDLKQFLADHYSPYHDKPLDLNSYEDKSKTLYKGTATTFQSVLVRMYEVFIEEGYDTSFSIPYVLTCLKYSSILNTSISFRGVRTIEEVRTICFHCLDNNKNLIPVLVKRVNTAEVLTDRQLTSLVEYIGDLNCMTRRDSISPIKELYILDNEGTVEELTEKVKEMVLFYGV